MIQLTPADFGALMFFFGMAIAYALAWIIHKAGSGDE